MAERKSTNKYYPIEWDPSKGSINTFVGQHPLRQRASKIDQGILVVRFELPWSTFCLKCERLLAKGVRFNAEKKKVGNYHSTIIWSFKMTCPSCANPLEVQTDPEHRDYLCVEGLKKRTVEYEASEDNQLEKIAQDAKVIDPFQKLENKQDDEEFAKDKFHPHLSELQDLSDRNHKNDYQNARLLRQNMRKQQKEIQSLRDEARAKSLGINLLPESAEDRKNAMKLKPTKAEASKAAQNLKAERFKVRTSSIFSTPNTSNNTGIAKTSGQLKQSYRESGSKVAIGRVSSMKK